MPNRFGRQIPVNDFAVKPLLPDGLLPVQRPDGSELEAVATGAAKLASSFNAQADQIASLEGTREGKAAGLDKAYRPQGLTTIRGQAFETAATSVYQDNLDASLRTDMQKVFEANKNEPDKLTKAFDALGNEYRQQHVFKEIEGAFNASFARLRLPYQNKALSNLESDVKDQNRAKLIDNITASQTNVARIAALDPMNPATAKLANDELTRIDGLLDEAVRSEAMTAEAAAKLKIANRNSITARAALGQADGLKTPDEVAAYRANFRKMFGAGKIANLTADGYDEIDSRLEVLQNAKRTRAQAGEALLQKNINDLVQRSVDGFPIAEDEWTRYAATPAAASANGQAILQAGQAKLDIARALRHRSVEDGERMVAGMRQTLAKDGATTAGQADLVNFADKLVREQRSALNTDQLGLAAKKQLIPAVAPLDFQAFAASNDPNAAEVLAVQFRHRTAQAHAVGSTLSRAPQFLRPEEKARLTEIVDQGGDKALALAGAIVKGADTDAHSVLKEISGDAPLLAQAGVIIANGGSLTAARDAFQAAHIKRVTGKELPGVKSSFAARAIRDEFGTAYMAQPEDASRIRATADAITRTRIERGGADPTGADAEKIYKRALQEAAGATFVDGVQYGGVANYKPDSWTAYRVPVPAGVRADAFRDVIRAVRDSDLAELQFPPQSSDGKLYTARKLAAAVPVAVRGGYRFASGDPQSDDPKYIRGADGRPFVLPFDSLAPMLRQRVPGAFLGGR